jgi:hypothetical protein
VDRLDQLFARSQREIEAHTDELGDTETGRYFIDEAAHLLAALRLWAQSQYRSDQVVREILESVDVVALQDVAHELRELGGRDPRTASGTVATMARMPSGQLLAIASYALRAL